MIKDFINGHTEDEIESFDYSFISSGVDNTFYYLGNFYTYGGEICGYFRAEHLSDIKSLFDQYLNY